jgi:hypothetical protein
MIDIIRPEKLLPTGDYCRWASNRQPYIFWFVRKDAQFYKIEDSSGNIEVSVLGTQMTSLSITVGDSVAVVDNSGTYEATGTILSISQNGTPDFKFVVDIPFAGNVFSGYINFGIRENYTVDLSLTGYVAATGKTVSLGTARGSFNSFGECRIDVRSLLTYGIVKENRCSFALVNEPDYSGWNRFTVSFADRFYLGGVESSTTSVVDNTIYYSLDGVKYLKDIYGQNFGDYFPVAAPSSELPRFLTPFESPRIFVGFPFTLSFIFPLELQSLLITSEEDELSSTGTILNHVDAQIDTAHAGAVNLLTIQGGSTVGTKFIRVWLETGGVAGNNYVADGYVADGYAVSEEDVAETPVIITEQKVIQIDDRCRKNPVYLMWKNPLGGWDYWLFDVNSETSISSQQGSAYEIVNDDIEVAIKREAITSARQIDSLTVFDIVTREEFNGLRWIEQSPQVFMLRGSNWIGVRMIPKGFKYRAESATVDVELSFTLPEYYNVSN